MASWFDTHAKASARGTLVDAPTGLSRRQVLKGGAVVAGAAWAAPQLLTATPAWAGASLCTQTNSPDYSVCGDNTYRCCPSGRQCVLFVNGTYGCDVPVGGVCGNQGNGQCNGGFSRCNHKHAVSICGGGGALCDFNNNAVCVTNSPCFPGYGLTGARCGGPGAPCFSDEDCASGSTGSNTVYPDLTCVGGTATTIGVCT